MGQNDFVYAMSSHRGRVRAGNEDSCDASPQLGTFAVCDGMGGAAAGEIASHLALQVFLDVLSGAAPPVESGQRLTHPEPTPNDAGDRLRHAIRSANLAVYRKAHESPDLQGMGTTLVTVLFEPFDQTHPETRAVGKLWVAHVGDSRCYLERTSLLHLVTHDHSVVEEQVRAGVITRAEAEVSPLRHVITRAVGSHHRVEPEIQSIEAYQGDLILLASDGLNRELTDEDIHHFLGQLPRNPTSEDLQQTCHDLIEAANRNGGRDNITVLLVHIG